MQVLVSLIISALMVLGSISYVQEKNVSLGANQKISELTALSSIDDADTIPVVDNSGTPTTKKITWANATSGLQTFYDGRYQTLLTNSAGLAAALSDEDGTGLVVFNTGANLTNATMATPGVSVGSDATGDMYYRAATGKLARLGLCSANQAIGASGGLPSCVSIINFPYTASSTFTATTTIDASSLTNNALVLNGLAYQWPSSRGNATKQFLTDNGTGVLAFASTTPYLLFSTTTAFMTTGAPVNIFGSSTLAIGTIGTNTIIRGKFYLSIQDVSANTKNLTLYLGGTSCATGNAIDLAGSTYNGILEILVVTGTSATSQKCSFTWTIPGSTSYFFAGEGTASIDNSAASTYVAVLGKNTDGNDIYTVSHGYVEVEKIQ